MIAISPATAADADEVVALWHACDLTRPWNEPFGDFSRALEHESATILVARDGGAIAGTAMTGFDGHRGWIYYLGVHPSLRRRGIAKTLLDSACEWLRERGCPKAELMLREGNPAADFYTRLGWDPQPVRVFARRLD